MTTWRIPARHGAGFAASQSVTARALRAGSTSMSRPVSRSKMPVTSSVGWLRWRPGTRSRPARSPPAPRGGPGDRHGAGRDPTPRPWPRASPPRSPGGPGDGLLTEPDPAGDLGSGPLGEHRPRSDLVGLLRPGPHRTGRLRAAPQPLGPHQHHRPISHRQVPHLDPAAAVAHGTTPQAAHQPRSSVVSTASHHSPVASSSSWAHDEPVEPEQRRHATTVAFHQGPPVDVSLRQPHQ